MQTTARSRVPASPRLRDGGHRDNDRAVASFPSIATPEGRTDVANARRFEAMDGDKARYCHAWKKWLIWDGKRWRIDDTGAVTRLAKQVVESVWKQAGKHGHADVLKFAVYTAGDKAIKAMLSLSQSELSILPADLDKDGWLFNVENGTINLQTGELKPHDREDFLTKLAPVRFDPDASSHLWDRMLDAIYAADQTLIAFAQRFTGYALTGSVREQVLLILCGRGANGKSTFLNALLDVFGRDYAIKADKSLLVPKKQEGHSTERMDLFGKRLVVCSETEDGHRLAESFVKDLTGGESIRGRRMREDTWEYQPTHKIVLGTNHRPEVRGTDHAIWRRLRLLPFAVQFWNPDEGDTGPETLRQDKDLPDKLKECREGILAWAVRGCLDWQANGLGMPDAVKAATAEYRDSEDILRQFIQETCIIHDTLRCRSGQLYGAYVTWCQATGEKHMSMRAFGETMTDRRYEKKTSNGVWYLGIGLREDAEQESR